MSGAVFVLAINVTITLVMAAAFFAIAAFDRINRPARWFGLAFVFAAFSFAGEYVLAAGLFEQTARMVIALSILLTFVLIAHALALRYRVPLPWTVLLGFLALACVLYVMILDLPRENSVRQVLYQLPYALISLISAHVVARARKKKLLEWGIIAIFILLAIHFMSKPLLAQLTGGVGTRAQDYSTTLYAAISQSSGGILLMILAMGALAMVVFDSAAAIVSRSEHDTQTGLLNQHGFENHTIRLLRAAGEENADCALTLFAVTGARAGTDLPVLSRSAAIVLTSNAGPGLLAGRMAPLDFALFEKNANLFTARRHAETIRSALTSALAEHAGPDISVSVGVTEREKTDSWADMLARALWALEEAQQAGGNCVRLAARSGVALSRLG